MSNCLTTSGSFLIFYKHAFPIPSSFQHFPAPQTPLINSASSSEVLLIFIPSWAFRGIVNNHNKNWFPAQFKWPDQTLAINGRLYKVLNVSQVRLEHTELHVMLWSLYKDYIIKDFWFDQVWGDMNGRITTGTLLIQKLSKKKKKKWSHSYFFLSLMTRSNTKLFYDFFFFLQMLFSYYYMPTVLTSLSRYHTHHSSYIPVEKAGRQQTN